ncbi:MAG: hypothetical protein OSB63_06960 [Planctomycetota bacterium]|nr:hypothetical protein [Planctomycetota bacterium]
MSFNFKNCVFGLIAVLPLAISCGPSLPDDGSGVVGGGATGSDFSRETEYSVNLNISFAGITDASALSPNEVLISWGDAMFIDEPASAAGMRYVIFRGLTRQAPLQDIGQIAITGQGMLTFTDDFSDLPATDDLDNTTWYYSVVAIDSDERISNNVQVEIARTPSAYAPGTMSFDDDVLPMFINIKNPTGITDSSNNVQNCLSCHSSSGAAGGMDLSTLEGILAGVGTPSNPDSFIIPFLGDDSYTEFRARFTAGTLFDQGSALSNHLDYLLTPGGDPAVAGDGLEDLALPIRNWAFEGALPTPDSTPPVFEFADVNNAGLYYGKFIDFDTVRLYIPHASDPESIPINGSLAGQIDYVVYAGTISNTIDWDHPVMIKSLTINEAGQDYVSIDFDWVDEAGQLLSNDLVVVVRPMDAAGRSVDIDVLDYDDNDQSQLDLFRLRMRNMSPQEVEMLITH